MRLKAYCIQLFSVLAGVIFIMGMYSVSLSVMAAENDEEYFLAAGEESYEEYLDQYADKADVSDYMVIEGTFLEEGGGASQEQLQENGEPVLLFQNGHPYAEYSVKVNQSGFYYIAVEYEPTEDGNRAMAVGLLLNGIYPFSEAQEISLSRIYQDASDIRTDSIGNEVTPQQAQVLNTQTHILMNTRKKANVTNQH